MYITDKVSFEQVLTKYADQRFWQTAQTVPGTSLPLPFPLPVRDVFSPYKSAAIQTAEASC